MNNELIIEWNDEDQPLSDWIKENDRDETPGKFLTRAVEILEAATPDREFSLIWLPQPWFEDVSEFGERRCRFHIIETDHSFLRFTEVTDSYHRPSGCGDIGFGSKELRDAFHAAEKTL